MKKIVTVLYVSMVLFISTINGQILLTEIMYNPPESGTDSLEFLEIYNAGNNAVDMTGWTFSEAITFTFPEFILSPKSYIVLCVNERAFKSIYGENIPVLQWTARALVNGGELVELRRFDNSIVFSVTYASGSNGWYSEADGRGASIELCNLEGNPNNKENWRPSLNGLGITINNAELFATPGADNSTNCSVTPDHIIEVGSFFFTPTDITINPGEIIRWINTGGRHNINGNQSTFPINPVSFGNGSPSEELWTYDFKFDTPGVYSYQSDPNASQMQGTVTVLGGGAEFPFRSIASIRGVNGQGVADSLGIKCTLIGQVYGVNIRPAGQGFQFTLIDRENDGVGVFSPVNDFGYTVQEGDEVEIQGTLEQFRGLLQINVSGIRVISTGNPNITPIIVNLLDEDTENRLVRIKNLTIVNPSEWTNAVGGFNVQVTDGTNEYTMRIARNVNTFLNPPISTFNLTGIGGQFGNTVAPFLSGYQILPRYSADFDFSLSTHESSDLSFSIYPNPVNSHLLFKANKSFDQYEIISLTGKVMQKGSIDFSSNSIDVGQLPAGSYFFKANRNGHLYSQIFFKY
jgi:plastocyanin